MKKHDEETFFNKKVVKGDCWIWQGASEHRGVSDYGQTSFRGKHLRTHQIAWILTHGEIPEGKWVIHSCNEDKCINPDHLYLGNHSDAMLKAAKGAWKDSKARELRRKRNERAKELEKKKLAILKMKEEGIPQCDIAKTLNTNESTVSRVINGKAMTRSYAPKQLLTDKLLEK